MNMTEQIAAWGYQPEAGESPECGTLPVWEDGDESERWTITYSVDGGEVSVELVDRSTNPHTIPWTGLGAIGDLRPLIASAYREVNR